MALRFHSTLLISLLGLSGCAYVAETTAPHKHPAATRSAQALEADALFWRTFHSGDYANIDPALEAVEGVYLAHPDDAVTAAHAGWLHIWRLAERNRLASPRATITDDITLARKYFSEAAALDPADARFAGFLASAEMAEGEVHGQQADSRRGYYRMKDAVTAWPQFNLFTAGYVMSDKPASTPLFRAALNMQWQDADLCAGAQIDRATGSFAPYMQRETTQGPDRACWNSAIAPHNFEGFFLNMGDMLVKAGDWQMAQKIYANAKLSRSYAQWPYRDVLERRIRDAGANVAAFNAAAPGHSDDRRVLFDTSYACMACHQE